MDKRKRPEGHENPRPYGPRQSPVGLPSQPAESPAHPSSQDTGGSGARYLLPNDTGKETAVFKARVAQFARSLNQRAYEDEDLRSREEELLGLTLVCTMIQPVDTYHLMIY